MTNLLKRITKFKKIFKRSSNDVRKNRETLDLMFISTMCLSFILYILTLFPLQYFVNEGYFSSDKALLVNLYVLVSLNLLFYIAGKLLKIPLTLNIFSFIEIVYNKISENLFLTKFWNKYKLEDVVENLNNSPENYYLLKNNQDVLSVINALKEIRNLYYKDINDRLLQNNLSKSFNKHLKLLMAYLSLIEKSEENSTEDLSLLLIIVSEDVAIYNSLKLLKGFLNTLTLENIIYEVEDKLDLKNFPNIIESYNNLENALKEKTNLTIKIKEYERIKEECNVI